MNNESIKKLLCEEINFLIKELERKAIAGSNSEVDYTEGKLNECMLIYYKLFPLESIPTSLWKKVYHAWVLAEKRKGKNDEEQE